MPLTLCLGAGAFGSDEFEAYLSMRDPQKPNRRRRRLGECDGTAPSGPRRRRAAPCPQGGEPPSTAPRSTSTCATPSAARGSSPRSRFDFNLPERFDLEYVGADKPHRPVMIHRALFGSVERFFGVLLEHYAGAFPAWLARCRCACCRSATTTTSTPARRRPVRAEGYRADLVEAGDPLGKRIRDAKLEKIPYVLVVGDDDVAGRHGRREPPGRRTARAGRRRSTIRRPARRPTSPAAP